ncbi:hypothetical protein ES703_49947 [subsurface metagenome]
MQVDSRQQNIAFGGVCGGWDIKCYRYLYRGDSGLFRGQGGFCRDAVCGDNDGNSDVLSYYHNCGVFPAKPLKYYDNYRHYQLDGRRTFYPGGVFQVAKAGFRSGGGVPRIAAAQHSFPAYAAEWYCSGAGERYVWYCRRHIYRGGP